MSGGAVRRILDRAQPGNRGGLQQHIRRGERLRTLIEARWGIQRPEQWRAKHVRWALERGLQDRSPATRYQYYRTARAIAAALGHWPQWEPYLRGSWTSPRGRQAQRSQGGRPPRLPR